MGTVLTEQECKDKVTGGQVKEHVSEICGSFFFKKPSRAQWEEVQDIQISKAQFESVAEKHELNKIFLRAVRKIGKDVIVSHDPMTLAECDKEDEDIFQIVGFAAIEWYAQDKAAKKKK